MKGIKDEGSLKLWASLLCISNTYNRIFERDAACAVLVVKNKAWGGINVGETEKEEEGYES